MSDEITPPDAQTSDGSTSLGRWMLLRGDRLRLALGITVGFFAVLQLSYALGVVGYADSAPVSRMASGMTAGSFSLITLVLTINQLILSQELGTAGQVRSRLEGMFSFRERIESATGVPAAPARPAEMVAVLARSTAETATALSSSVADHPDADLRDEVDAYARTVDSEARGLAETVDTDDSTFATLVATFGFAGQRHIHAGRELHNRTADRLPEATRERFDELVELLKLFDIGRSHFETIYLRRELAALSRTILVVGVPAVVAALLINLIYGAGATGLPADVLPFVVSLLVTVVFAPVAILASYLLRAATVAYENATVGPMVLDGDRHPSEVDGDTGGEE